MKQFLLHLTLLLSLVLVVGCESQQETPKPEPIPEPTPEVFSLNIEVTNITPYNAVLTITPSNDSDSYACVFLSSDQVPVVDDDATMMQAIIERYDPAIFTGVWSEELTPLNPNTTYTVLAFGINNGTPTSDLFRYDFTSAEAEECKIAIESIDLVKLFDSREIIALDPSYEYKLAQCECVAIVEMKTSAPTDKVYFWWYEEWMTIEYSEEAFLEDLLLYEPTDTVEAMDMYYSMGEDDRFFFAGIAEDEDGNLSPVYFGEMFTLSKSQCDPAEEFFQYVGASSATTFAIAR
ncbi:MAG: hypothetical protein J6Q62_04985 [Alistipes sp.]|nr:hypothetical protein [Alistipes sp.]